MRTMSSPIHDQERAQRPRRGRGRLRVSRKQPLCRGRGHLDDQVSCHKNKSRWIHTITKMFAMPQGSNFVAWQGERSAAIVFQVPTLTPSTLPHFHFHTQE